MHNPVIATRTLLLVVLVSVGFVIAGGGLVGATDDGGQEYAPTDSLDASIEAPSGVLLGEQILRTPGASVQSSPLKKAEDIGNESADSNRTGSTEKTGPPSEKQGGASTDRPPKANSEDAGSETADSPDRKGRNAQTPEQPSDSGRNPGAVPRDTGSADQQGDNGSPPAEPGSGDAPAHERPGASPNDGNSSGPPEWVDSPGGPGNWSSQGPSGAAGPPNGTARTVAVGGENVTVTVGQGPPDGVPGHQVVAHVTNATPNGSIPVDLPRTASNDSVRTERLSVTLSEGGDFSLGVTTRTDRDANRTPEFQPQGAAEGLGYISVDHTVPDSEIETVAFRFAIEADRITPSEREDISLYRHHNGSWNEVPTSYVARNDTAYIFKAESPGLSEFTVGKKVPSFEIMETSLLSSVQTTADPVAVRVRVTNDGDADGVYTARLLLDQEEMAKRQLSIAAGGTRQASFEESIDEPGEYSVLVNNHTVGDLDVKPAAIESETDGDPKGGVTPAPSTLSDLDSTEATTSEAVVATEMPGFGILAGLVGLLIATVTLRHKPE